MASIIDIDFTNNLHNSIIMTLCRRNNFYHDDIYVLLYKDLPENIKSIFISKNINYKEQINKILNEKLYGKFIVKNTKVLGFLLFSKYEDKDNNIGNASELLYILIDKDYRNNKLGDKLIREYLDIIDRETITYSYVKIDSKKLETYYKKYGFTATPDKDKFPPIILRGDDDSKYISMFYVSNKIKKLFNITNSIKKLCKTQNIDIADIYKELNNIM
jgi:predicted GNAT family N-acyltransferase